MNYPFSYLSTVLSGKGSFKIFPNQVVMFRLLITFSGNKLNPVYGKNTTDELIPDIIEYLKSAYLGNQEDMCSLHTCIYKNILEPTGTLPSLHRGYGFNRQYLTLSDSSIDAGNINKTVNGSRSMPMEWIQTFSNEQETPEKLIQRIFWLLQYFCVYYCQHNSDIVRTSFSRPLTALTVSKYPEFFSLTDSYKEEIIKRLRENCSSFSPLIRTLSVQNFDFHILSRIIFDIIKKHYLQSQTDNVSYTVEQTPASSVILSSTEQWDIYTSHIAIFGRKTIDRFHILKKYANENFYAANDLASIYFYGETFVFEGGTNFYHVVPDYKKSAEYLTLCINNSSPAYPPACWFMGYLIYTGYLSDYEKSYSKFALAEYYFEKAGDYAPAYNSLAQMYLKEAETIYNATHSLSDQLLAKFVTAIEYADKASHLGWLYGHNVIAFFISRYENDTKLLSAIAQRATLITPFDYEQQLLASSKYKNPWGLHNLAVFYISKGDKKKALPPLLQATELNYHRAYFTLAEITEDSNQSYQYLLESSSLGLPNATFKLALLEYEKNNFDKYQELLFTAKQQNFALPEMDLELQKELDEHLNQLKISAKDHE